MKSKNWFLFLIVALAFGFILLPFLARNWRYWLRVPRIQNEITNQSSLTLPLLLEPSDFSAKWMWQFVFTQQKSVDVVSYGFSGEYAKRVLSGRYEGRDIYLSNYVFWVSAGLIDNVEWSKWMSVNVEDGYLYRSNGILPVNSLPIYCKDDLKIGAKRECAIGVQLNASTRMILNVHFIGVFSEDTVENILAEVVGLVKPK